VGGSIETDLRELGWGGMEWIYLAQDRKQRSEHVNEPSGSVQRWDILE
jgi:hypothetical protein